MAPPSLNPIEIAKVTSTLAAVLAGFSFLVFVQYLTTSPNSGKHRQWESFGLSFMGLTLAAFLSSLVAGESKAAVQRAYTLMAAKEPLLIASFLLLAFGTLELLEAKVENTKKTFWSSYRMLAILLIPLVALYSVGLSYGALKAAYHGGHLPVHHLIWVSGAYPLALVIGAVSGWSFRYSFENLRAPIYLLTVLASGTSAGIFSLVYEVTVPTWDLAIIAGAFTLLEGSIVAVFLGGAVQDYKQMRAASRDRIQTN